VSKKGEGEALPPKEGTEVIDQAVIETALVIPDKNKTEKALALLKKEFSGLIIDCSTPAGEKDAREKRRMLVSLRTTGDKRRLELNKPEKQKIDDRNAQWKLIESAIEGYESPIDKSIKDVEAIREREAEEKKAKERERIAAIQEKIRLIQGAPSEAAFLPSDKIRIGIANLEKMEIGDDFGDFKDAAEAAKSGALTKLNELLTAKTAEEEETERLRVEREEFEAQKAKEDAERQERLAREELERQDREREEQERIAEREKEVQAEQEKLRLEREAFEKEQAASREKQEAEAAERDRQREKFEKEQETIRLANEQAQKDRDAEAERLRLEQERLDSLSKDYDIILRNCGTVGWLGLFIDKSGKELFRTGKHTASADAALTKVKAWIDEQKK
jgi:DNA repair exonuclease SbcCD ATPase subunit